jgi:hypothetical protein
VILSFIKVSRLGNQTVIDKLVVIAIVLFLITSILSYVSIRSKLKGEYYEKISDIIFVVGSTMLAIISVVIGFEVIH